MSLFRLPDSEPLVDYDAALAERLLSLLIATLRDELGCPEDEAQELAGAVQWTVTRERDGMWLNLAHGDTVIGAGGNPRRDVDGLTLHVRQMAYALVSRDQDFEP